MASPRIVVVDGGSARAVPLRGELTVGRAADAALRLDARDVSRCHARFGWSDGAAWVEDAGSRNGTFVNGQRLAGRRRLRPGDTVRIGGDLLRYDEGESALELPAATPPPLPRRTADRDESTAALLVGGARAPAPRGWRRAFAAALRAIGKRGRVSGP